MKGIMLLALVWVFCSIAINTSAQTNRPAINNAEEEDIFYHTVERGQTVYSIAKMYDVKPGDIHRLNFGSDETIKAGDKLKIPQKKIAKTSVSKPDSAGQHGQRNGNGQPDDDRGKPEEKSGVGKIHDAARTIASQ